MTILKQKSTFLVCSLVSLCCLLVTPGCLSRDEQTLPSLAPAASPIAQQKTFARAAASHDENTEIQIWYGQVNSLNIRWTTKDLYIEKRGSVETLFSSLLIFQLEKLREDWRSNSQTTKAVECEYSRTFKVMAVVGTLLSFQDESSIACGSSRPSTNLRFTTVDLNTTGKISDAWHSGLPLDQVDVTKPGRIVKLTDYFSEDEIFRALMANPSLANAMQDLKSPKPVTLSDLRSSFQQNQHAIHLEGELFRLDQDFITRFNFHHVENDKVIVQLSLSPIAAAAQATSGILNLQLPLPARIQQDLTAAQNLTKGFLAKDAQAIARGRSTEFFNKF